MNAIRHLKETLMPQRDLEECDPDLCVICRDHRHEPLEQLNHCRNLLVHRSCFHEHVNQTLSRSPSVECPLCHQNFITFQVTREEYRRLSIIFLVLVGVSILFHFLAPLLYLIFADRPEYPIGYPVYLLILGWHLVYYVGLTRKMFHVSWLRMGTEKQPLLPTVHHCTNTLITVDDNGHDLLSVRRLITYYFFFRTWFFYTVPSLFILFLLKIPGWHLPTSSWVNLIIVYLPVVFQCLWWILFVSLALIAILMELLAISLVYLTRFSQKIRLRQLFLRDEIDLTSRLTPISRELLMSPGSPVSLHSGSLFTLSPSSGESIFQTADSLLSSSSSSSLLSE